MKEASNRYDRIVDGGVLAGVAGGLFLTAINLLLTAIGGQGLWPVLKGASAPYYGARAMAPGFDFMPLAVGLIAHFTVSITWALLFAFLFYGLSRQATVLAGALWGVVVWLGMYRIVLPAVGLGAMARGGPVALPLVEHVLFGVVVAAAFLPYQRMTDDRWRGLRRRVESG